MMLSMLKGYQYYVVYVEMLLVTSMMLSMWKGCQYDVVYVERALVLCCLCGNVTSN